MERILFCETIGGRCEGAEGENKREERERERESVSVILRV